MKEKERKARLLCEKALQTYFGDNKEYARQRKQFADSTDAHKKLSVDEICDGVCLFTIFTKMGGGSIGTINLYSLLQSYLLDIDMRRKINELLGYDFDEHCYFEKIEKPDLGSVEGLLNFLKELIEMDFLRLRRCYQFEILTGGMIDNDAIKLGQHIRNMVFTIAKLTELSEIEKQIRLLDERTREILGELQKREAKEAELIDQMKALEAKVA